MEQETVDEYLKNPKLRIEDNEITDVALAIIDNLRKKGEVKTDDDGYSIEETLRTTRYNKSDVDKLQNLLNKLHADESNGNPQWKYLGDRTISWFDAEEGTLYSLHYEPAKYKGRDSEFSFSAIRYKKKGEENNARLRIIGIDPREMTEDERRRRGDMLVNGISINVEEGKIKASENISARKAAEKFLYENVGNPLYYNT